MQGNSGETASAPSREIVQARDLTPVEEMSLTKAVLRLQDIASIRAHDKVYWIASAVFAAGVGAAVFAFAGFVDSVRCLGVHFPLWGLLAAIIAAVAYMTMWHRTQLKKAGGRARHYQAGTRFSMDDGGMSIAVPSMLTYLPWHGMTALDLDGEFFLIQLSSGHVTGLSKTSFANQDVEGFCAELQRRWHAARKARHAG